jgi:outer membrane protein
MKQNASRSIGFSLSIPIFNRFETSGRVKQAKADIAMQQLSLDAAKRTLVKEVQQAYYNAVAAREKMRAAKASAEAAQMAQSYMKERFDAGKSTSFELNESNNRLLKSLSEQIQAKYDFIFRCKILGFYSGKPLI